VLLDALVEESKLLKAQWLWLEVRVSNARAIEVYERYGFRRINVRKSYYPLDGLTREDALVMNYSLA
jgi:ribosomal-protein-alanine N-acetyltransferase